MRQLTAYILGLLLLTTSCGQVDTESVNKTADRDTTILVSNNEFDNHDSITYDELMYPNDTTYVAEILESGTFHQDEVCIDDAKKIWFGIFKGKDGSYISQTKIQTSKVYDPVIDEDTLSEKTGWEVVLDNEDTSVMLISGLDFLTNRQIKQCIFPKDIILPGDTVLIKYLGLDYKMYSTGGKSHEDRDTNAIIIWNYKLYITSTVNGQKITELLFAAPRFDDAFVNIIFAGDIDGDGILDLIIDTSTHYNGTRPTLYLSKPANKGQLLKAVGEHTSVGC